MGFIPVALIVLYLVVGGKSAPDGAAPVKKKIVHEKKSDGITFRPPVKQIKVKRKRLSPEAYQKAYRSDPKRAERDFETIYQYITQKYQSVSFEDARQIAQYLVDYGKKFDIDPKLVAALMARESSFNTKAVSSTGARGLGQIKDFNYKSLGISDPHNLQQNTSGTAQYLKQMFTFWDGKRNQAQLALASYFKGHGAVSRDKGRLDRVSKRYADDILNNYNELLAMSKHYTGR